METLLRVALTLVVYGFVILSLTRVAAARLRVLDCKLFNRARDGKKGSGVCLFQLPTPKLSTMPSKPAT
jgi:hypothetical protein